jgi:putative drug exporter of the RND superfamily
LISADGTASTAAVLGDMRGRDAQMKDSHTGRVITAAAAVMVAVFVSFALGDDRVLRLFGIAMASAVFLDGVVIRNILLPAVLELSGRRTWAFPSWADRRLPRLTIEPATEPVPALDEAA